MREKFCNTYDPKRITLLITGLVILSGRKISYLLHDLSPLHVADEIVNPRGELTPVLSPNHCNFYLHSKYLSSYSHISVVLRPHQRSFFWLQVEVITESHNWSDLERSTNYGVPFPRQHFCKLQLIYILVLGNITEEVPEIM